jgi:hypothetical protein
VTPNFWRAKSEPGKGAGSVRTLAGVHGWSSHSK